MASLKDLKNRIKSVKSTQKITKAMKMVAAAKLRRAKDAAEAARPYAERMEQVLANLAASMSGNSMASPLLIGTGQDQTHLLIVATSDRGLAGPFNSSIVRGARKRIRELQGQGKTVKLFMIGRKGIEQLQMEFGSLMVGKMTEVGKKKLGYIDAQHVVAKIMPLFHAGEFDVATIVYNHFKSAIAQVVTFQQLIPLPTPAVVSDGEAMVYEYEPSEDLILADLLPKNVTTQIFKALLENAASEQGSRMSAMDNATRNAGDMIKRLNLVYNRTRQAAITKELIEIISGAEAV